MSLTGQRRIGAFKQPKATGATVTDAEALAATALAALANEPTRLGRFMTETGAGPDELRAAIGSRDLLCAVLEHVLADESLLLVVASEAGVKPEAVATALDVLRGPAGVTP